LVVMATATQDLRIGLSASPDAGGLFIQIEIGGEGNTISSIRACSLCMNLATSNNLLLSSGWPTAFWVNVYHNIVTVGAGSTPGLGDKSKFMSFNFAGIGYENVSVYQVSIGASGESVDDSSVTAFPAVEWTGDVSRYMVRWPLRQDATCTIQTIKGSPVNFPCDGKVTITNDNGGIAFTGYSMNSLTVHADVPHQQMLATDSFTAMIWARNQLPFPRSNSGDYRAPMAFRQGHGGPDLKGFNFYCDWQGVWSVWMGVGANGSNWGGIGTALPCTINQWFHLAVTFDALTELVVFYINGRSVGSTNMKFVPADDVATVLRLGGGLTEFGDQIGGLWWDGDIAAASFYNFALSPTSMIDEMSGNGPV